MTVPPWLMITKHDNKIHSMPSLWLLPFVSTVVASAYIHALTIKHAVTPKFWHGFHPKQT